MSTEVAVPDPPYSPELIADLHADALPPEVAAALWPRVRQDPEARRVLDALDATTHALADLGADASMAAPIPADVLAHVLPAGHDELAARRRRRWLAAGAGVAAAAAAVVVAFVVVDRPEPAVPQAVPTIGADLPADALLAALGKTDALADTAGCLEANGLSRSAPVLGTSHIEFDGKDAVLILTSGPRAPQVRALIVGAGCGQGNPQTLAVKDIG